MDHGDLPAGLDLTRTTREFDAATVPDGLLHAHSVRADSWGRLVMRAGTLRFVWEDGGRAPVDLVAGDTLIIEPSVLHHVELGDDARFVVEFHRRPTEPAADGRSAKQRMLAGDLYRADDPELAAESLRARELEAAYNDSAPADDDGRRAILTELLGGVGEGTVIRPPFLCDYGYNIRIGAASFVNFGLVALDVAAITIGDHVQIGPNVQLLTPTHPIDPTLRRAGWEAAEPITIGNNVWLGGGVIVLPGVTIGDNTVVGAGAVVSRDLPANVVAYGNPACVQRRIAEE